jgi:ribosomal protein S12 methylthiotransferase accessory factor YcaO
VAGGVPRRVDTERALENAITELLDGRAPGKTICPSEAARRVDPQDWRPLMESARRVAARLVEAGEVEMTQQGQVVDPATAKGPVRLRRS